MPEANEKIKQVEGLLEHGAPLTDAVARALGCSLAEFARRNGFESAEVSMCLRAYPQRAYPPIRDAVCEELGAERAWLDALIETQRPEADVA